GRQRDQQTGDTPLKKTEKEVSGETHDGVRNLERLLGVVAFRLVHTVLDPGAVDHLESPALYLRDELLAERLVEAAHELLGALRVPVAFIEPLKPLQGFNERAVVFGTGPLVA